MARKKKLEAPAAEEELEAPAAEEELEELEAPAAEEELEELEAPAEDGSRWNDPEPLDALDALERELGDGLALVVEDLRRMHGRKGRIVAAKLERSFRDFIRQLKRAHGLNVATPEGVG